MSVSTREFFQLRYVLEQGVHACSFCRSTYYSEMQCRAQCSCEQLRNLAFFSCELASWTTPQAADVLEKSCTLELTLFPDAGANILAPASACPLLWCLSACACFMLNNVKAHQQAKMRRVKGTLCPFPVIDNIHNLWFHLSDTQTMSVASRYYCKRGKYIASVASQQSNSKVCKAPSNYLI